jgi:DNA-binding LytR/AlgR family response regulator
MEKIRVLIVDDEKLMCEELQCLIGQHPDATVVGICHNGEDALRMTAQNQPDLIFLDIEMPGLNGLEVAARLAKCELQPVIVFATAFDQFALQAFAVNAVDYILKPFDDQDVERVMQKAKRLLASRATGRKMPELPEVRQVGKVPTRKFSAEKDNRLEIIDSSSIQLIFARDRMVFIRTVDGQIYNTRLSLQDFEVRLDEQLFFRCHRNYIVNVDQIQQILTWFKRGYLLLLKGKEKVEVPVSRAYTKKLREYIQI